MKQAILLSMSVALLAAPAVPTQPQENIQSEIRNLEMLRFRALTGADVPALERLLSDDLIYTHASGWRQTKAEFLASIRSGELLYHSFASESVNVHGYGNVVLVTGHAAAKVRAKGQELSVSVLYLEVYVKQNGRWQLVAWQSTRLAP